MGCERQAEPDSKNLVYSRLGERGWFFSSAPDQTSRYPCLTDYPLTALCFAALADCIGQLRESRPRESQPTTHSHSQLLRRRLWLLLR